MNTGPVLVDVAVKDLSRAALNWAVAQVVDYKTALEENDHGPDEWIVMGREDMYLTRDPDMFDVWSPSTDWSQGGPLIDKYDVELIRFGEQAWYERDPQWNQKPCVGAVIRHAPYDTVSGDISIEECMTGETRLIAVCRAIVAAKLGDIVKVPACLVLP